jgi:UDP-N-acetylmuramyl tripeptide synthase
VVTDVNCFDEDPEQIAQMLAQGASEAGKIDGQDLFVIIDRREAIKKALSLALPKDVVVITAKGTEPCRAWLCCHFAAPLWACDRFLS